MKLKILTLILFIAVVVFIAIEEPIAGIAFFFLVAFVWAYGLYDESKYTITQLEKSIAEDKELFNELLVENEELEKKIAKHKQHINVLGAVNNAGVNVTATALKALRGQHKEIVNLNATIKELSTTIDSMKAKKS